MIFFSAKRVRVVCFVPRGFVIFFDAERLCDFLFC